MIEFPSDSWALILGGSSGFGLATAKKLARHGMNLCVVHRDLRGVMSRIEAEFDEIRRCGHRFLSLNLDALSADGRETTLNQLADAMGPSGRVRLLMHSIAFGNLKPLAPVTEGTPFLSDEDMARTIDAMGTSLLTWVRDLFNRKLLAADARVIGLTSEGNTIAWPGYAAVSAAKAVLESVSRAIAVEFAPYGIRSNIIQAGVTDTPALRAIPGHDRMKATAERRNPFKRLTRPEDIANFICLMCTEEAAWANGAIFRVDGGEHIAGHQ